MKISPRKIIASLLVSVIVYETFGVPMAQASQYDSMWESRKKASSSTQVASLPLNQLPSIASTLPSQAKSSTFERPDLNLSPELRALVAAVPQNAASVRDVYSPFSVEKPVVLIQDIHMNAEAQMNLAAVIENIAKTNKIGAVAAEGAFRPFDFAASRKISKQDFRKDLAEAFVKKNLMGVASYVGIAHDKFASVIGIDDRAHYDANVAAYLTTRPLKKKTQKDLSQLKAALSGEKAKIFSKELLAFDGLRAGYHGGSVPFGVYLKKLSAITPDMDFVIDQFLQAYEMETSLDFNRVENERRTVIGKLARVLKTPDVNALLEQSVAYRSGQIGFGSYYRYLKSLCEKNGIALRETPAFDNYIRYVLLSDGIKAEKLFERVQVKELEAVKLLARTPEEKALADKSEWLTLSEKLLNFELTPNEWTRYKQLRGERADFKAFENFYEEADVRSHLMVSNLIALKSTGATLLVSGGFHTAQMTEILKAKRIPYIVVTPKLAKIENIDGSAYLSEFSREKTPLEKMFAGSKLFVMPDSQLPWGTDKGGPTAAAFDAMQRGSNLGTTGSVTAGDMVVEPGVGGADSLQSVTLPDGRSLHVRPARTILRVIAWPFVQIIRFISWLLSKLFTTRKLSLLFMTPVAYVLFDARLLLAASEGEYGLGLNAQNAPLAFSAVAVVFGLGWAIITTLMKRIKMGNRSSGPQNNYVKPKLEPLGELILPAVRLNPIAGDDHANFAASLETERRDHPEATAIVFEISGIETLPAGDVDHLRIRLNEADITEVPLGLQVDVIDATPWLADLFPGFSVPLDPEADAAGASFVYLNADGSARPYDIPDTVSVTASLESGVSNLRSLTSDDVTFGPNAPINDPFFTHAPSPDYDRAKFQFQLPDGVNPDNIRVQIITVVRDDNNNAVPVAATGLLPVASFEKGHTVYTENAKDAGIRFFSVQADGRLVPYTPQSRIPVTKTLVTASEVADSDVLPLTDQILKPSDAVGTSFVGYRVAPGQQGGSFYSPNMSDGTYRLFISRPVLNQTGGIAYYEPLAVTPVITVTNGIINFRIPNDLVGQDNLFIGIRRFNGTQSTPIGPTISIGGTATIGTGAVYDFSEQVLRPADAQGSAYVGYRLVQGQAAGSFTSPDLPEGTYRLLLSRPVRQGGVIAYYEPLAATALVQITGGNVSFDIPQELQGEPELYVGFSRFNGTQIENLGPNLLVIGSAQANGNRVQFVDQVLRPSDAQGTSYVGYLVAPGQQYGTLSSPNLPDGTYRLVLSRPVTNAAGLLLYYEPLAATGVITVSNGTVVFHIPTELQNEPILAMGLQRFSGNQPQPLGTGVLVFGSSERGAGNVNEFTDQVLRPSDAAGSSYVGYRVALNQQYGTIISPNLPDGTYRVILSRPVTNAAGDVLYYEPLATTPTFDLTGGIIGFEIPEQFRSETNLFVGLRRFNGNQAVDLGTGIVAFGLPTRETGPLQEFSDQILRPSNETGSAYVGYRVELGQQYGTLSSPNLPDGTYRLFLSRPVTNAAGAILYYEPLAVTGEINVTNGSIVCEIPEEFRDDANLFVGLRRFEGNQPVDLGTGVFITGSASRGSGTVNQFNEQVLRPSDAQGTSYVGYRVQPGQQYGTIISPNLPDGTYRLFLSRPVVNGAGEVLYYEPLAASAFVQITGGSMVFEIPAALRNEQNLAVGFQRFNNNQAVPLGTDILTFGSAPRGSGTVIVFGDQVFVPSDNQGSSYVGYRIQPGQQFGTITSPNLPNGTYRLFLSRPVLNAAGDLLYHEPLAATGLIQVTNGVIVFEIPAALRNEPNLSVGFRRFNGDQSVDLGTGILATGSNEQGAGTVNQFTDQVLKPSDARGTAYVGYRLDPGQTGGTFSSPNLPDGTYRLSLTRPVRQNGSILYYEPLAATALVQITGGRVSFEIPQEFQGEPELYVGFSRFNGNQFANLGTGILVLGSNQVGANPVQFVDQVLRPSDVQGTSYVGYLVAPGQQFGTISSPNLPDGTYRLFLSRPVTNAAGALLYYEPLAVTALIQVSNGTVVFSIPAQFQNEPNLAVGLQRFDGNQPVALGTDVLAFGSSQRGAGTVNDFSQQVLRPSDASGSSYVGYSLLQGQRFGTLTSANLPNGTYRLTLSRPVNNPAGELLYYEPLAITGAFDVTNGTIVFEIPEEFRGEPNLFVGLQRFNGNQIVNLPMNLVIIGSRERGTGPVQEFNEQVLRPSDTAGSGYVGYRVALGQQFGTITSPNLPDGTYRLFLSRPVTNATGAILYYEPLAVTGEINVTNGTIVFEIPAEFRDDANLFVGLRRFDGIQPVNLGTGVLAIGSPVRGPGAVSQFAEQVLRPSDAQGTSYVGYRVVQGQQYGTISSPNLPNGNYRLFLSRPVTNASGVLLYYEPLATTALIQVTNGTIVFEIPAGLRNETNLFVGLRRFEGNQSVNLPVDVLAIGSAVRGAGTVNTFGEQVLQPSDTQGSSYVGYRVAQGQQYGTITSPNLPDGTYRLFLSRPVTNAAGALLYYEPLGATALIQVTNGTIVFEIPAALRNETNLFVGLRRFIGNESVNLGTGVLAIGSTSRGPGTVNQFSEQVLKPADAAGSSYVGYRVGQGQQSGSITSPNLPDGTYRLTLSRQVIDRGVTRYQALYLTGAIQVANGVINFEIPESLRGEENLFVGLSRIDANGSTINIGTGVLLIGSNGIQGGAISQFTDQIFQPSEDGSNYGGYRVAPGQAYVTVSLPDFAEASSVRFVLSAPVRDAAGKLLYYQALIVTPEYSDTQRKYVLVIPLAYRNLPELYVGAIPFNGSPVPVVVGTNYLVSGTPGAEAGLSQNRFTDPVLQAEEDGTGFSGYKVAANLRYVTVTMPNFANATSLRFVLSAPVYDDGGKFLYYVALKLTPRTSSANGQYVVEIPESLRGRTDLYLGVSYFNGTERATVGRAGLVIGTAGANANVVPLQFSDDVLAPAKDEKSYGEKLEPGTARVTITVPDFRNVDGVRFVLTVTAYDRNNQPYQKAVLVTAKVHDDGVFVLEIPEAYRFAQGLGIGVIGVNGLGTVPEVLGKDAVVTLSTIVGVERPTQFTEYVLQSNEQETAYSIDVPNGAQAAIVSMPNLAGVANVRFMFTVEAVDDQGLIYRQPVLATILTADDQGNYTIEIPSLPGQRIVGFSVIGATGNEDLNNPGFIFVNWNGIRVGPLVVADIAVMKPNQTATAYGVDIPAGTHSIQLTMPNLANVNEVRFLYMVTGVDANGNPYQRPVMATNLISDGQGIYELSLPVLASGEQITSIAVIGPRLERLGNIDLLFLQFSRQTSNGIAAPLFALQLSADGRFLSTVLPNGTEAVRVITNGMLTVGQYAAVINRQLENGTFTPASQVVFNNGVPDGVWIDLPNGGRRIAAFSLDRGRIGDTLVMPEGALVFVEASPTDVAGALQPRTVPNSARVVQAYGVPAGPGIFYQVLADVEGQIVSTPLIPSGQTVNVLVPVGAAGFPSLRVFRFQDNGAGGRILVEIKNSGAGVVEGASNAASVEMTTVNLTQIPMYGTPAALHPALRIAEIPAYLQGRFNEIRLFAGNLPAGLRIVLEQTVRDANGHIHLLVSEITSDELLAAGENGRLFQFDPKTVALTVRLLNKNGQEVSIPGAVFTNLENGNHAGVVQGRVIPEDQINLYRQRANLTPAQQLALSELDKAIFSYFYYLALYGGGGNLGLDGIAHIVVYSYTLFIPESPFAEGAAIDIVEGKIVGGGIIDDGRNVVFRRVMGVRGGRPKNQPPSPDQIAGWKQGEQHDRIRNQINAMGDMVAFLKLMIPASKYEVEPLGELAQLPLDFNPAHRLSFQPTVYEKWEQRQAFEKLLPKPDTAVRIAAEVPAGVLGKEEPFEFDIQTDGEEPRGIVTIWMVRKDGRVTEVTKFALGDGKRRLFKGNLSEVERFIIQVDRDPLAPDQFPTVLGASIRFNHSVVKETAKAPMPREVGPVAVAPGPRDAQAPVAPKKPEQPDLVLAPVGGGDEPTLVAEISEPIVTALDSYGDMFMAAGGLGAAMLLALILKGGKEERKKGAAPAFTKNLRGFEDSDAGVRYASSVEGQEWLKSKEGRQWLKSNAGRAWMLSARGDAFLTKSAWLKSAQGREWLMSANGLDWLASAAGRKWMNEADAAFEWLSSPQGLAWTNTKGGKAMLESADARNFFRSYNGGRWQVGDNGGKWLAGREPELGARFLQTDAGVAFLSSKKGIEWLGSPRGQTYVESDGWYEFLLSTFGQKWILTDAAIGWLSTPASNAFINSRQMIPFLATPEGEKLVAHKGWLTFTTSDTGAKWLAGSGFAWLISANGLRWLAAAGDEWLRSPAVLVWVTADSLKEFRESDNFLRFLLTSIGASFYNSEYFAAFLETDAGRDWLRSDTGRAWFNSRQARFFFTSDRGVKHLSSVYEGRRRIEWYVETFAENDEAIGTLGREYIEQIRTAPEPEPVVATPPPPAAPPAPTAEKRPGLFTVKRVLLFIVFSGAATAAAIINPWLAAPVGLAVLFSAVAYIARPRGAAVAAGGDRAPPFLIPGMVWLGFIGFSIAGLVIFFFPITALYIGGGLAAAFVLTFLVLTVRNRPALSVMRAAARESIASILLSAALATTALLFAIGGINAQQAQDNVRVAFQQKNADDQRPVAGAKNFNQAAVPPVPNPVGPFVPQAHRDVVPFPVKDPAGADALFVSQGEQPAVLKSDEAKRAAYKSNDVLARFQAAGQRTPSSIGDPTIDGVSFYNDLRRLASARKGAARPIDARRAADQMLENWPLVNGGPANSAKTIDGSKHENESDMGPVLEAAIMFLDLWSDTKDPRYFKAAKNLFDYAIAYQREDGEVAYSRLRRNPNPEYQLNMVPARRLFELTGDLKYRNASEKALAYMMAPGVNGQPRMYDPNTGLFCVRDEKGEIVGFPGDAQGLALSKVGPAKLALYGVDIAKMVRSMSAVPNTFVYEWLKTNLDGLRIGSAYLRANGKVAEADAADKAIALHAAILAGVDRQPAAQGGGLAYMYRLKPGGNANNPKDYVAAGGQPVMLGRMKLFDAMNGTSLVSEAAFQDLMSNTNPMAAIYGGRRIDWAALKKDVPTPAQLAAVPWYFNAFGLESDRVTQARKDLIAAEARFEAAKRMIYPTKRDNGESYAADAVAYDPITGRITKEFRVAQSGLGLIEVTLDPLTGREISSVPIRWMPKIGFKVTLNDQAFEALSKMTQRQLRENGYLKLNREDKTAWLLNADPTTSAILDMRLWNEDFSKPDIVGTPGDAVMIAPSMLRDGEDDVKELGFLSLLMSVAGGSIEADQEPEVIGFVRLQFLMVAQGQMNGNGQAMFQKVIVNAPIVKRLNLGVLRYRAESVAGNPELQRLVETIANRIYPPALDNLPGGARQKQRREQLLDAYIHGRAPANWNENQRALLEIKDRQADVKRRIDALMPRYRELYDRVARGEGLMREPLYEIEDQLKKLRDDLRYLGYDYDYAYDVLLWISRFEGRPADAAAQLIELQKAAFALPSPLMPLAQLPLGAAQGTAGWTLQQINDAKNLYFKSPLASRVIMPIGVWGHKQALAESDAIKKEIARLTGLRKPEDAPRIAELTAALEQLHAKIKYVQERRYHLIDEMGDPKTQPAKKMVFGYERVIMAQNRVIQDGAVDYELDKIGDARRGEFYLEKALDMQVTHSDNRNTIYFGVVASRQRLWNALMADAQVPPEGSPEDVAAFQRAMRAEADAVARRGGVRTQMPIRGQIGDRAPIQPTSAEERAVASDQLFSPAPRGKAGVVDSSGYRWARTRAGTAGAFVEIQHPMGWSVAQIYGRNIKIRYADGREEDFDQIKQGSLPLDATLKGDFMMLFLDRGTIINGNGAPDIINTRKVPLGHQELPVRTFFAQITAGVALGTFKVKETTRVNFTAGTVDRAAVNPGNQLDAFSVPTWDSPAVVVTERTLAPGYVARFPQDASGPMLNPKTKKFVAPKIEFVRGGVVGEVWEIERDPRNNKQPRTDSQGRITYKRTVTMGDQQLVTYATYEARLDTAFLYSIDYENERHTDFYDVDRAETLYLAQARTIEFRTVRKDEFGRPTVFFYAEANENAPADQRLEMVETQILVGQNYDSQLVPAQLPRSVQAMIADKDRPEIRQMVGWNNPAMVGKNPVWRIVRTSPIEPGTVNQWGAAADPTVEEETPWGLTRIVSSVVELPEGKKGRGGEIARYYYPKVGGRFLLAGGGWTSEATESVPTQPGKYRFTANGSDEPKTDMGNVLWTTRGRVVAPNVGSFSFNGTLNGSKRLPVLIESRVDRSDVLTPQVEEQDHLGRPRKIHTHIPQSGQPAAWIVSENDGYRWNHATQRWTATKTTGSSPNANTADPKTGELRNVQLTKQRDGEFAGTHARNPLMPDAPGYGDTEEWHSRSLNAVSGNVTSRQTVYFDALGRESARTAILPGTADNPTHVTEFYPQVNGATIIDAAGTFKTFATKTTDISDSVMIGIQVRRTHQSDFNDPNKDVQIVLRDKNGNRVVIGKDGQVRFVTLGESTAFPYFVKYAGGKTVGAAVIPMVGRDRAIDTADGSDLLVIPVADLKLAVPDLDLASLSSVGVTLTDVDNKNVRLTGVGDIQRFRSPDGLGADGDPVSRLVLDGKNKSGEPWRVVDLRMRQPVKVKENGKEKIVVPEVEVTRGSRGNTVVTWGVGTMKKSNIYIDGQLTQTTYFDKEGTSDVRVYVRYLPTLDGRSYVIFDWGTGWAAGVQGGIL